MMAWKMVKFIETGNQSSATGAVVKTPGERKAFISFSSNEALVANHLSSWLKGKLKVDCFCSERPEAIDAGTDWYERITEAASGSEECLLLLSPDSLLRGWIHFEAGVALGASIQETSSQQLTAQELKAKRKYIIPVLYGGVQAGDIPSNLSRFQCLDLADKAKFDAFAQRLHHQGSSLHAGFHDDFLASMSSAVKHQFVHGEPTFVQAGDEVRTEILKGQTFNQEKQALDLKRSSKDETLFAVRLQFVPQPIGDVQKWKFGIELRNPNIQKGRVFQIHAGCHDGQNTWSLYSHPDQIIPTAIPADFRMRMPATLQLWLSKDGRFGVCVGIGSQGKRKILLNEQDEKQWRFDSADWTTAIVSGWADGSPYRVDMDHLETDWVRI